MVDGEPSGGGLWTSVYTTEPVFDEILPSENLQVSPLVMVHPTVFDGLVDQ